ncbi:MAG: hypothetical protein K1X64_07090 [Myxococcaceae bacterium]|nr:hypothetical protein [Myxococcaceae bacterium]
MAAHEPPLLVTGPVALVQCKAMERTSFDILAELFAKDIDPSLVKRGLERSPTERIEWLEQMQQFADAARKAARLEAERSSQAAR